MTTRPRSVRGRGRERTTPVLRKTTPTPRGGPRGSGFTGAVHYRHERPEKERAILAYLAAHASATLAGLTQLLGYGPKSTDVSRAVRGLAEEGLVERISLRPAVYVITEEGRKEAEVTS